MRLLGLIVFLAFANASCDSYLSWRHAEVRDAAETVFQAAVAGDSSALADVANSEVQQQLALIRRDEPALLRAAAERLQFVAASVEADTAVAHFFVSVDDTNEEFALRMVRQNGEWRVVKLNVPSRI